MNGAATVEPPARAHAWAAAGFAKELVPVCGPHHRCDSPGKIPHFGGWQTRSFSPHEFGKSSPNTGLRTRLFPAIDIDVEDASVVAAVEDVAREILGTTARRSRCNSARCALLYRLDGEPFSKRRILFDAPDGTRAKIEVLGDGQQLVVDGVHASGAPLEWTGSPIDGGSLASMNIEARDGFLSAVRDALEAAGCHNVDLDHGDRNGERKPAPDPVKASDAGRARKYADGAIAKARRAIEGKPEGERNDELNRQAFGLGQLVAGGVASREVVEAELTAAALRVGLTESETRASIRSGLDAGARDPRGLPSETATDEPPPPESENPPPPESENPPRPGSTPTDASSQFEPFSGAKVPPFPVEALPAPLARYVEALATHLQVPADGPALMALAVLAAVCAKRIRVRRLADGYEQPLNLYLLGLGEPGERKSQIVAEVVRPLRAYEAREAERLGNQIAIERQERQLREDRMKVIRRILASGKVRSDSKALRAELDDLTLAMAKPALRAPRLVTSSPTSGALEQLLAENGERMAILSAEGGAFGIVAGRFAGNSKAPPDMDVYLSAWSGDAGDADRVSREGTRLKAPALTIGMFVQPQVLREVSSIYGADEKGLTSRFLIAKVQPCADRQHYLGPPMDEGRRDAWASTVDALLGSLPEQEQVIVLRTEILEPAKRFFDEVTPQMAPGGPLSGTVLRAFASKLRGQVERLAGLLHVAEHGPLAADMPCSEATIGAAATLTRYFLAHGKVALGEAGADPVLDRARRVVEHLVYNRIATFTRRDVQIGKWGGCRKPEQVDETLLELETRGYLTKTFAKRERPGVNGPTYHLRPGLF